MSVVACKTRPEVLYKQAKVALDSLSVDSCLTLSAQKCFFFQSFERFFKTFMLRRIVGQVVCKI